MSQRIRLFGLVLGASAAAFAAVGAACSGDARPAEPTAIVTRPTPTPSRAVPTAHATPPATPTTPATETSTPDAAPPTPVSAATETVAPPAPPPAPVQPTPVPPVPRPSQVSLTVRANALAFDVKTIRVFAGTTVAATMHNEEAGVQHNLAFSLPGLAHGETCTGPCTTTQSFQVESPGSYFFLCTLHDMVGSFIVEP